MTDFAVSAPSEAFFTSRFNYILPLANNSPALSEMIGEMINEIISETIS